MFELGTRVTIGGCTMLRPGFRLAGLTGRVVSSRHDAPPGTTAVLMDWAEHGYEAKELPGIVNVATQFLTCEQEKKATSKPPQKPVAQQPSGRPHLRLI